VPQRGGHEESPSILALRVDVGAGVTQKGSNRHVIERARDRERGATESVGRIDHAASLYEQVQYLDGVLRVY